MNKKGVNPVITQVFLIVLLMAGLFVLYSNVSSITERIGDFDFDFFSPSEDSNLAAAGVECGNGEVQSEFGEACDCGTDGVCDFDELDFKDCKSFVYNFGNLGCTDSCFFDLSECTDVMPEVNISSCQELSEPDTLYLLNRSLLGSEVTAECLKITGEGSILDCQDYSVKNSNLEAIIIRSNADGVTIRNCEVEASNYKAAANGKGAGIYVRADNNVVQNNIVTGGFSGISVRGYGNIIEDNYIERCAKAIHIVKDNNVIRDNVMVNNHLHQGWGIGVWGGEGNQFMGNSITNSRYGVVLYDASDSYLGCNEFSGTIKKDLYIYATPWYSGITGTKNDNIQTIGTVYGVKYVGSGAELIELEGDCYAFPQDFSSYWKFDVNTDDENGVNDGTLVGGASIVDNGRPSNVLTLYNEDYVNLDSAITPGLSEVSLTMWVNINEDMPYTSFYDESNGNYWQFSIDEGKFYTRDTSTGTTGFRENDLDLPSIPQGEWHHLAFVYSVSNSLKTIYLDGSYYDSTSVSIDQLTSARTNYKIGRGAGGKMLDGSIDDMIIYGRALSGSEIGEIFIAGGGVIPECGDNTCDADEDCGATNNYPECNLDCGVCPPPGTYYLDAANGNDNNPGTQGLPWQTIEKAQSIVVAGTVYLADTPTYATISDLSVVPQVGGTLVEDCDNLAGWNSGGASEVLLSNDALDRTPTDTSLHINMTSGYPINSKMVYKTLASPLDLSSMANPKIHFWARQESSSDTITKHYLNFALCSDDQCDTVVASKTLTDNSVHRGYRLYSLELTPSGSLENINSIGVFTTDAWGKTSSEANLWLDDIYVSDGDMNFILTKNGHGYDYRGRDIVEFDSGMNEEVADRYFEVVSADADTITIKSNYGLEKQFDPTVSIKIRDKGYDGRFNSRESNQYVHYIPIGGRPIFNGFDIYDDYLNITGINVRNINPNGWQIRTSDNSDHVIINDIDVLGTNQYLSLGGELNGQITLSNSHFENIEDGLGVYCENCVIKNNVITDFASSSIKIDSADNVTLEGNKVYGKTYTDEAHWNYNSPHFSTISLRYGNNIVIRNNTFHDIHHRGFYIYQANQYDIVIENNVFYDMNIKMAHNSKFDHLVGPIWVLNNTFIGSFSETWESDSWKVNGGYGYAGDYDGYAVVFGRAITLDTPPADYPGSDLGISRFENNLVLGIMGYNTYNDSVNNVYPVRENFIEKNNLVFYYGGDLVNGVDSDCSLSSCLGPDFALDETSVEITELIINGEFAVEDLENGFFNEPNMNYTWDHGRELDLRPLMGSLACEMPLGPVGALPCVPCGAGDTITCDTGDDGICSSGFRTCNAGTGNYDELCENDFIPKVEDCSNGDDDDCNGYTDCRDTANCALDEDCDGLVGAVMYLNANDNLVDQIDLIQDIEWRSGAEYKDKAFAFNGSNYIRINDLKDHLPADADQNLTLSFWMDSADYTGGQHLVGLFSDYPQIRVSTSNSVYVSFDPTGSRSIGSNIVDGETYHVVLIGRREVDDYYWDFYLNGQKISDRYGDGPETYTQDYSTRIGSASDSCILPLPCGWPRFNGTIDDVRIFNRALDAGEIEDIYDSYLDIPCDLTTASWSQTAANEGDSVLMQVAAESCVNEPIEYSVWRVRGLFGIDWLWPDKFITDTASESWIAGQGDSGFSDGDEYYFKAKLADGSDSINSKGSNNLFVSEGIASSVEIPGGYISYYSFDTDSGDSTLMGGASIAYDLDLEENVLILDGVDDYVQLPSALTAGLSEATLSMWVKPGDDITETGVYDEANGIYWQFSMENGKFYTRDSSTGASGNRGETDLILPSMRLNQWHNLVLVYSISNSLKAIYLDGLLVDSHSESIDVLTSDRTSFRIGLGVEGNYYKGSIDDFLFYNRALSEGEILDIYGAQDYSPSQGLGTYYVSIGGSGSECSEADPCSLDYGVAQAWYGEEIIAGGGDYGQLILPGEDYYGDMRSPLPQDQEWITLKSAPGETAIFSGGTGANSAVILGDYSERENRKVAYILDDVKVSGKMDVNPIAGFKIINSEITGNHSLIQYAYGGVSLSRSNDITIDNCVIHTIADDAIAGTSSNLKILNNDISKWGADAIHPSNFNNLLIENNTIHHSDVWNLEEDPRSRDACASGVNGACTHADVLQVWDPGTTNYNFTFRNNVVRDLWQNGIGTIAFSTALGYENVTIEGNVFRNLTGNQIVAIGSNVTGAVIRDNTFSTSIYMGRNGSNIEIYNNIVARVSKLFNATIYPSCTLISESDLMEGITVFEDNIYYSPESVGTTGGLRPCNFLDAAGNYLFENFETLEAQTFIDYELGLVEPRLDGPACDGSLNPVNVPVGALPCV
jgi:parallel beta-helix repeat protein